MKIVAYQVMKQDPSMYTLDLAPELGAIDLLEEVETSFGIKIGDPVVERIATVGELYDAIRNLTPAWDMRLPHRWAMLTGLAAEHGFCHRPRFSRHIFTLEKFEVCQQVSVKIGTSGVESIELFGVIMSLRALLVPPYRQVLAGPLLKRDKGQLVVTLIQEADGAVASLQSVC